MDWARQAFSTLPWLIKSQADSISSGVKVGVTVTEGVAVASTVAVALAERVAEGEEDTKAVEEGFGEGEETGGFDELPWPRKRKARPMTSKANTASKILLSM